MTHKWRTNGNVFNSGLKGAGAFYTLANTITPITPKKE
jgi:hypothetical protein